MSIASTYPTNPYSPLQSLLQPGTQTSTKDKVSDPLAALFASLTGANSGGQPGPADNPAGGPAPVSGAPPSPFSPSTLAALISQQGQQSSATGGDAAALPFGTADADDDGQIGKDEAMPAIQSAQKRNGHHKRAGGAGRGDPLADLLSSKDATGATTQTTTNGDGSTSTTVTYADGKTLTRTTPAAPTGNTSSGSGSGNAANLMGQLIKMQAQVLTQAAGTTLQLAPI